MHTLTAPRKYPLVQPSHIRKAQPFAELTQDQALIRAKHDARSDAQLNALIRAASSQRARRFTNDPPSCFGVLA